MKDKPTRDTAFEQFVRKSLEKTNDTPDNETWANIAALQQGANLRLRFRYYGARAAVLIGFLLCLTAGWYYTAADKTAPLKSAGNSRAKDLPVLQHLPEAATFQTDHSPETGPARQTGQGPATEMPARRVRVNTAPSVRIRFAAEEGLRYENPATGTSVFIPANALVRSDGSPVAGEVEFQLQEYRSMAEFAASGIPMHYSDERGTFFFNSGGMFDMRVNQRGEQLRMAEGEAFDVRFTSTHPLTQPSLYFYDETAGEWQYQPDPAFGFDESQPGQPVAVSEATAIRNNKGLAQNYCMPLISNITSNESAAAWMKEAVQTGYDLACGKTSVPQWFRKRSGDWDAFQLQNGLERGLVRLARHRDVQDMFFPEDLNNVFTELKAFKDCYFIVNGDSLTKGTITEADLEAYWERVTVVQVTGAVCNVSFLGKQGLLQFYATLIGSTENTAFDSDKVMGEYNRLRAKRQAEFENTLQTWKHFMLMTPAFQTPDEWCMKTPNEWFSYFETNLPMMRSRFGELVKKGQASDDKIALKAWKAWREKLRNMQFDQFETSNSGKRRNGLQYALRVTNFGLYNCDQIFRMGKDPVYILALFKTPDGKRVVSSTVSVMERSTKLFFTLPDADDMIYIPGRHLDIIVRDIEGRFYHLSGDDYSRIEIKDPRSCTFTLEDVTEKTKTPRDWANLLEI
ncbi:MAG: hypothetical protein IPK76_01455 [Lewinellaceae bacterium]|jgi:hypothetical protein|nr:hypothetical protein [Lewinellaceae bacterium]